MKHLSKLWVAFLAVASLGIPAEHAPELSRAEPLEYMILVSGGELLEGAYPDAHTPFLTQILRPLGCRCVGVVIVGDESLIMKEALAFATNKAPLVIVTGGLGPTPNDITRDVLSQFTGLALVEHPEALAHMERRFHLPQDQLRLNLRRQALVPARGGYLKNETGTAVGLVFDPGPWVIVALPGPPRELRPMTRNELVPFLQKRFGIRALGASLSLRFVGVGQSQIDQTIQDHVPLPKDVIVTSIFEGSRVDFTFALPGNSATDQARLDELQQNIRRHLGDYVYANNGASLEETVLKSLAERGRSMAVAEIGSRGHLAAAFNEVEGAFRFLTGSYVAPNSQAMARLLQIDSNLLPASGQETSQLIGAAAAKETRSEVVIAVGPVESDAAEAGHVWVAFQWPGKKHTAVRIPIRRRGELKHANLTTDILDRLRRQLTSGP